MTEDQLEKVSDAKLHTMRIEDITRDEINRNIVRKQKENDPSLHFIAARDGLNFSQNENQYYLGSPLEYRALANALGTDQSLKRLNLYSKEIGTEGARALGDALRTNCTLEELILSGNSIGNEGARALADAMGNNSSLKKLYLNRNKIGNEGAHALANSLRTNHSLKRLYISGNDISNKGAFALADALRVNRTLEELSLGNNNIGNGGALAFASALVKNSNLKDLGLYFQSAEKDDINNKTWTTFSELLCDVSSVNATYRSNHTLQTMQYSLHRDAVNSKLNSYLFLNYIKSNINLVRMEKILKHHRYIDMKPFFEQGWEMLPYVFDWLEKARSHASSNPTLDYSRRERGSDNTIAIKEERIMNEKLNAIHQFACAMPDVFDREAHMGAR